MGDRFLGWTSTGITQPDNPSNDGKDGSVGWERAQQRRVETSHEDLQAFLAIALNGAVPEAIVPSRSPHAVHL